MTTCPSGVNYMHLVDQARAKIEKDYTMPVIERLLRAMLAWIFPWPELFGAVMTLAQFGRPLAALLPTPQGGIGHADLIDGKQGDAGACAGQPAAAGSYSRKRSRCPR